MRKNLLLLTILFLLACSNEFKIERSILHDEQIKRWGWVYNRYSFFHLVSNYEESKYDSIQVYVADEFNRMIIESDSLEYLQFDFYKKNWNTSRFLSDDPYDSKISPVNPENNCKYWKYFIECIYYKRIERSNKWIYYSEHAGIKDTIEVKTLDKLKK